MEDKEKEMRLKMQIIERYKKAGLSMNSDENKKRKIAIVKNMLKMRNQNNEPYFNAEFLYKRYRN